MFARLNGIVDTITDHSVILDVSGVGYLVTCSRATLSRLSQGGPARLFIETQVREDAINLYGFMAAEEQAWFRLLTTVQGVGARVGMSILSAVSLADMGMAIAAQDQTIFTRADGVGPKLATRIVTELKSKIPESFMHISATPAKGRAGTAPARGEGAGSAGPESDALSALVNLGYGRAEAFAALMRVKAEGGAEDPDGMSVSQMIRLALAELSTRAA